MFLIQPSTATHNIDVLFNIFHVINDVTAYMSAACSGQLSLLPSVGQEWVLAYGLWGEDLVRMIGGGGMPAGCTGGPTVRWRGQWMAA